VREAHDLAEKVECDLRRAYPTLVDVTIHIEPNTEEERL
jgi:divalent metal cation (Fe/Co/Zn/Cd) transporter